MLPGPDDLVDPADALGAVRQRRDRLRPTGGDHLGDAEQVRRRGDQWMHTTVGCRWAGDHDRSTPATWAGITDMSTVLGYAARPPGT